MRPIVVLLVVASAVGWAPGRADGAHASEIIEVGADLVDCVDNVFTRFDSFERVNLLLPPGFEAKDASAAAGAPVPLGSALLAGVSFECGWSELDGGPVTTSWVFAIVETPSVSGLELEQGVPPTGGEPWLDLYILGYYTSGDGTAALLRDAGLEVVGGHTTVDFGPTNTTARSTVSDDRGPVATVEVVGALAVDKQPNVRFWFQSERGLGYFRWNRSPYRQYTGDVVSCSLRPDTTIGIVFDGSDCSALASPTRATGTVVSDPSSFRGVFRFLSGVAPERVR
jgi:hypothetical protein